MSVGATGNAVALIRELRDEAIRRGMDLFGHGPGVIERGNRFVVEPRVWKGTDYSVHVGRNCAEATLQFYPEPRNCTWFVRAAADLHGRKDEIERSLNRAVEARRDRDLRIALSTPRTGLESHDDLTRLAVSVIDNIQELQRVLAPIIDEIACRYGIPPRETTSRRPSRAPARVSRTVLAARTADLDVEQRCEEGEPHPIVSLYGSTRESRFPLILLVGREPNTSRPIEPVVGLYDLEAWPRCGFWNAAYCLVARTVGKEGARDTKGSCIRAQASPLVIADSLPIGIRSGLSDKGVRRREVCKADILEHARGIFSFPDITARIRLVLLSGLDGDLAVARQALMEECDRHGLEYRTIPFLTPINMPELEQSLDARTAATVRGVWSEFSKATGA